MECPDCGGEMHQLYVGGWWKCDDCAAAYPERDCVDNRPSNSDTHYAGAGRVQFDEFEWEGEE